MNKKTAIKIFLSLKEKRQSETLNIVENQVLHDASEFLIDLYRKCISWDELDEDELAELDYQ